MTHVLTTEGWAAPHDPDAGTIVRDDYITYALKNILATANAVDGDTSATTIKHRHLTGTNAARPAAGEAGRMYYATDDPKCMYLDNGSAWIIVGGETPRCRVYNSTNQSIPNATDTALAFDSERFDNDTMHSTVTNNSRITMTKAGLYLVGGSVAFQSDITTRTELKLRHSTTAPVTTVFASQQIYDTDATQQVRLSISSLYVFAATDFVELIVHQASGSAYSVMNVGNTSPEFWAIHQGGA